GWLLRIHLRARYFRSKISPLATLRLYSRGVVAVPSPTEAEGTSTLAAETSQPLRMGHELLDDLRRRHHELRRAADAEAGELAQLDRQLRHLHGDRDAVDDRRAVDIVLVQRREQEHRDAAAGDQHLATAGDERLGLRGEQVAHLVGERLRFIGLKDLPG